MCAWLSTLRAAVVVLVIQKNYEFLKARGCEPCALKESAGNIFPALARVVEKGKKLDVVSLAPRYVCWQESKIPSLDCTGPSECIKIKCGFC